MAKKFSEEIKSESSIIKDSDIPIIISRGRGRPLGTKNKPKLGTIKTTPSVASSDSNAPLRKRGRPRKDSFQSSTLIKKSEANKLETSLAVASSEANKLETSLAIAYSDDQVSKVSGESKHSTSLAIANSEESKSLTSNPKRSQ